MLSCFAFYSATLLNYVPTFGRIMFGSFDWLPNFCLADNYVGRFLDFWHLLLLFMLNFVRLYGIMFGKCTGASREETHEQSWDEYIFPRFSWFILIITGVALRSNMADESITFELGRHVSDIIGLIEWNTCQSDFIQFRLDWLYNTVVRYCDNIPSGEAVMALIQEATELLRQSEDDGFSQNVSFQAEITSTGQRGRPCFIISKDQLTFLLDLGSNPERLHLCLASAKAL